MQHLESPIDWQNVLEITSNKPELAKEIVAMLGKELPHMKQIINDAYHQNKYASLADYIHKLHGSCCYCGVHKLRSLTAALERNLKRQQYSNLPTAIKQLNEEIDSLLSFMQEQKIIE